MVPSREKQRHWCRCWMKSQACAETKDKNRNHDAMAMRARAALVCRAETERPTTRTTATLPPPTVSPVPLLCVLCPALSCSPCAVLSGPQQRKMSSVTFYPTADECSKSLKTWRDQEARLRRRLPGEPRCNETTTPLSVLEFRTVQRVLTRRLQPRPFTDRVMLPSSVRTTLAAVGRLSHETPFFTNEPLQFEATTITRAHHFRVLHDDQDQRAARIFRDLETRGPVVHGREPVPHSEAVHRSTHHPLGTGCRQPQARREPQRRGTRTQYHSLAQVVLRRGGSEPVRLLGGTDKELCEGEVLLSGRKGW